MINLLSEAQRQELRAAHQNVVLRSYLLLLLGSLGTIVIFFGAGFYLTHSERSTAEQDIADHKSQISSYKTVKADAEAFSSNLSTAKTILSQEILYSDLIIDIAKTLPDDAVLTALSLNEEIMAGPMILSARVQSNNAALNLKSALEKSDLFTDVNLVSVQENSSQSGPSVSDYPVAVSINVTFDKAALEKGGKP